MTYDELKKTWQTEDVEYINELKETLMDIKAIHVNKLIKDDLMIASILNKFIKDLEYTLNREQEILNAKYGKKENKTINFEHLSRDKYNMG